MARRFLLRFREAEVKVRGVETFKDTNLRDGEYSSPVNTSNEYEYWAQARSRDPCVHSTYVESTAQPKSCPRVNHKTNELPSNAQDVNETGQWWGGGGTATYN